MGGGPAKDHLLIVIPYPEPEEILTSLQTRFPALKISYIQTTSQDPVERKAQVPAHLWSSATILVTLFTFPTPTEAPNLELIHLISAGSNQLQGTPIWKDTDIVITTSTGIHGPQIAEWVVLTGLVASHKYNTLYEWQKKRQWGAQDGERQGYGQVRDMVGRRVGVLGYGSIGRQVGRVAKAMGMDVVAYTASKKDTPEQKRDGGFIVPGTGDEEGSIPSAWYSGLDKESLRKFLSSGIDWLVISVPLTDQTRHFLGKEEFDALSHGGENPAFVTNIARGAIIEQDALIEALKDGRLRGAALDVTDPEPLPKESELWGLENVIVTPHVSGGSAAYKERTFQVLERNLQAREKGDKLVNVVNRGRGY